MTTQHSWHKPAQYEIEVQGVLSDKWCDWFEGVTVESGESVTKLSGKIADQAALHGLFVRIRDLGVTLNSVKRVESE